MNAELKRGPVADFVLAALMVCFGGAVIFVSADYKTSALEPIGPSAFPLAAALIIVVLSASIVITASRRRAAAKGDEGVRPRNDLALIALVMTIAYFGVMQLEWVPFQWATVGYVGLLTAQLFDWRVSRLPAALVLGLIMGMGLQFVFTKILFIDLP